MIKLPLLLALRYKKTFLLLIAMIFFVSKNIVADEHSNDNHISQEECNIILKDAQNALVAYKNIDFKNDTLNEALNVYGLDRHIESITGKLNKDCTMIED